MQIRRKFKNSHRWAPPLRAMNYEDQTTENKTSLDMTEKIITGIIKPSLENNVVVWSPHIGKDINKLEKS